jgi:hypothetical protein
MNYALLVRGAREVNHGMVGLDSVRHFFEKEAVDEGLFLESCGWTYPCLRRSTGFPPPGNTYVPTVRLTSIDHLQIECIYYSPRLLVG